MYLQGDTPQSIEKSIYYLKKNCPIIAPCDTIYGFLGKVFTAQERIRDIKGRSEDKPFLIITKKDSVSQFSSQTIPQWVNNLWPCPLTVVVFSSKWYQKHHNGLKTVALRVPSDKWLQTLLEKIPFSLYSTSVNRSGQPFLNDFDQIVKEFEKDVPLIVRSNGETKNQMPSTIVDLTTYPYKVLRKGALLIPQALLECTN